jgi:hypothetical protein
VDSSGTAEDPVVGCYEHSNEPLDTTEAGKLLINLATTSFLTRILLHGITSPIRMYYSIRNVIFPIAILCRRTNL